jgi:hypothetical protein
MDGWAGSSHADLAFLRAVRVWGEWDLARITGKLAPNWRQRIDSLLERTLEESADEARSSLWADHLASIRPDFARVHPSWLVRALKDESPAVRQVVAAKVGPPLGDVSRRGVDPAPSGRFGQPDPEAVGWALDLWTERLVGDVSPSEFDPPVVAALTNLRPRDLARLIKTCGVVKLSFAMTSNAPDESIARFSPLDRVRFGFFRRYLGVADPRLVELARLDLDAVGGDRRWGLARLGLVTFGRLLAAAEPHRARWALQHLPYPIARTLRGLGAMPGTRKPPLAWESWILEAASSRLEAEGRDADAALRNAETTAGVRP